MHNFDRDGDGMEEVYQDSGYKSAWRPLSRECGTSAVGSPSPENTQKGNSKAVETDIKADEADEQNDIVKRISDISADIKRLDRRLQDQDEKISNLFNLLEGREGAGKKYIFGQPRK